MATASTGPTSWFDALRRRWSMLLRWFSRSQTSPSRTALPATRDEPPVAAPAPAAAVIAETTASVTSATSTSATSMTAARPPAPPASVIIRAATAASSGVLPAPQAPAPAVRVVERAADSLQAPVAGGGPVLDPSFSGLGQLSVRMFFSKMLASTPEGLTIDFTRWQSASVERFFLAITSPGLIRRREAPTTGDERMTLPTAFDGFEWD